MKRLRCCQASTDLHPAPLQSDRERCLFAARALSLSLYIFKESSLNNNVLRYCVWMLCMHQRVRRERGRKKTPKQRACVYLFSVSQMLGFNVAQRLPVGVSAPAASFHLCQGLSFHGVTHLVKPARSTKQKRTIHCWSTMGPPFPSSFNY